MFSTFRIVRVIYSCVEFPSCTFFKQFKKSFSFSFSVFFCPTDYSYYGVQYDQPLTNYSSFRRRQLRSGKSTPIKDQNFICGQCGKGYKWIENLKRHQRECGQLPRHKCHVCMKFFFRRYELTNHLMSKHNIGNATT